MNRVILQGHLTRDVELRFAASESSTAIARFSVAINRRTSADGNRQADFPNCVAFGKTAEAIEQYFKKGDGILLEGHLQTGSYTNQAGQKVYTTDVVVDRWEFPASRRSAAGANDAAPEAAPAPETPAAAGMPDVDNTNIDDEIPFN